MQGYMRTKRGEVMGKGEGGSLESKDICWWRGVRHLQVCGRVVIRVLIVPSFTGVWQGRH